MDLEKLVTKISNKPAHPIVTKIVKEFIKSEATSYSTTSVSKFMVVAKIAFGVGVVIGKRKVSK